MVSQERLLQPQNVPSLLPFFADFLLAAFLRNAPGITASFAGDGLRKVGASREIRCDDATRRIECLRRSVIHLKCVGLILSLNHDYFHWHGEPLQWIQKMKNLTSPEVARGARTCR